MQAGRAGRDDRQVRALEAERDRHVARDHVDDRRRHEERRDAARAALRAARSCVSSIIGRPPMPEPIRHADALRVFVGDRRGRRPAPPASPPRGRNG